jgi:hypothetical protein
MSQRFRVREMGAISFGPCVTSWTARAGATGFGTRLLIDLPLDFALGEVPEEAQPVSRGHS